MKRRENKGVMESHPQEHQVWNVSLFQKIGMVSDLWLYKHEHNRNKLPVLAFTPQDYLVPMQNFQTKVSQPL